MPCSSGWNGGQHPVNWEYLKAEWYPHRPHVLPCTTLHVKGHLSPASVQVAKNMKTQVQILIFMIWDSDWPIDGLQWSFAYSSPFPKIGFPDGSDSKESACNAGELGSIPGLGRSPEGRYGNPLQHSCLESPMDRGAWSATVRRVKYSYEISTWKFFFKWPLAVDQIFRFSCL